MFTSSPQGHHAELRPRLGGQDSQALASRVDPGHKPHSLEGSPCPFPQLIPAPTCPVQRWWCRVTQVVEHVRTPGSHSPGPEALVTSVVEGEPPTHMSQMWSRVNTESGAIVTQQRKPGGRGPRSRGAELIGLRVTPDCRRSYKWPGSVSDFWHRGCVAITQALKLQLKSS